VTWNRNDNENESHIKLRNKTSAFKFKWPEGGIGLRTTCQLDFIWELTFPVDEEIEEGTAKRRSKNININQNLLGEFSKNRHSNQLRLKTFILEKLRTVRRISGSENSSPMRNQLNYWAHLFQITNSNQMTTFALDKFKVMPSDSFSLFHSIAIKFTENLKVHCEQNWIARAPMGWPTAVEISPVHRIAIFSPGIKFPTH